jgi:tetratricopeptide (TPR) repeat protein
MIARSRPAVLLVVGIGTLALGLAAGGCSGRRKAKSLNPVGGQEAAQLEQERQKFEMMKDPPLTAETHYAAGQLAEAHGSTSQAVEQYRKALKIDRDHLPSLYRMGMLYAQFKHYDEAIKVWKTYVHATRDSAVAYSNLGLCYEFAGRSDEAERAYQKGIERDSASGPCRVNYGIMLARHGRTNEAVFQFQAVLAPADVHYNLASVYEGMGRVQEARLEYRKAMQHDPQFRDAALRLAKLEQPVGQPGQPGSVPNAAAGESALAGQAEPAPE